MRVEGASRSGLGSLHWAQSHCFGASPVHVVPLWLTTGSPQHRRFSPKSSGSQNPQWGKFFCLLTHSLTLPQWGRGGPARVGRGHLDRAPDPKIGRYQGLERRVEAERARRAEGQERPSNGPLPFLEQGGGGVWESGSSVTSVTGSPWPVGRQLRGRWRSGPC